MAYWQNYNGTLTAGTKITSATTGFVCPKGFAGILGVTQTGAAHSGLELSFPNGDYEYDSLDIPTMMTGEIAVETRLYDAVLTPVNLALPEGTAVDVTPSGGESSTEGNIIIVWGRSGEFTGPRIHWMHADITTGTTADNAILVTYPRGLSSLAYGHANAANAEILYWRGEYNGRLNALPATHNAVDAQEINGRLIPINEPVNPNGGSIYLGDVAAGYGAGAAGDVYFGFV